MSSIGTPIPCAVAVMPDDSIGSFLPMGHAIVFELDAPPVAGKPVLFSIADGRKFIRFYEPRPDGTWLGVPSGDKHPTFDSSVEPLTIIGAFRWADFPVSADVLAQCRWADFP